MVVCIPFYKGTSAPEFSTMRNGSCTKQNGVTLQTTKDNVDNDGTCVKPIHETVYRMAIVYSLSYIRIQSYSHI